jgi:hypothetical protein
MACLAKLEVFEFHFMSLKAVSSQASLIIFNATNEQTPQSNVFPYYGVAFAISIGHSEMVGSLL